jgi:spermidine/putrescine transport system ATP-binding protein
LRADITAKAGLSVEGLRVEYGALAALGGVSLSVPEGHYLVLLGPSGSGKSTLLSVLGGFTQPTRGRVLLDGADITHAAPADRPTATVFQDYALFPHMDIGGNVAFGLKMRRVPAAEREARVRDILGVVGLEGMGGRRIDQASGGQRQRVALARALVIKPKVLLLDEPLGALDMSLRARMQDELWHLQRRTGATFVHVTHDQEEAMNVADTIAVMNAGAIEDLGPPERVYFRPRSAFTAGFMGESNRFEAVAGEEGTTGTLLQTPLGPLATTTRGLAGRKVSVIIRPEHLRLSKAKDAVALDVTGYAFQGSQTRLFCKTGSPDGLEILAKVPSDMTVGIGDTIRVAIDPRHVVVLGAETEEPVHD